MTSMAGTSIAPARNLPRSGAWRLAATDKDIREGSLLYRVLEAHLENFEAAYEEVSAAQSRAVLIPLRPGLDWTGGL